MSFRLAHEWTLGPCINGMQLATCAHCGTLRSTIDGIETFFRRERDEHERVRGTSPACVSRAEVRPTEAESKRRMFRAGKHVPMSAEEMKEARERNAE